MPTFLEFEGQRLMLRPIPAERPKPSECPHCEYERQFPGFERGGWIQQDNNGPIVSCPICNDDGSFPRD